MEYLERKITVFEPSYVKPLYVVQNSNMREIRISITDWDIPSGADVYWQVATSTKGELNVADVDGNTIYIRPYTSTFSEAGKGYLQARVEHDGRVLISFSIDVYIQPDRVSNPTEGSNSNVIRVLVEQYVNEATEGLINQVETEVQRVIETIPSDYTELESRVDDLENSQGGGLTEEAKQALLACFAKVAWIDEDGQTYYDALENALYAITEISVSPTSLSFGALGTTQQLTGQTRPTGGTITWISSNTSVATVDSTGLVTSVGYGTATITASCQGYTATCSVTIAQATVTSISAVYTQSGTVYDTDSLNTLKSDLVVTANWSNGTTSTVASTDYTLSGTLAEGTSIITVSYGGKTTTFNVTVTAEPVPTFALNRAIAIDGLTLSSGMINDNGEVVSSNNSYFVDEFYDGEKVAYIRDDTLITLSNNQPGRAAYYDSSNNFVKRVWINGGSTVHPPIGEQYAKQKLGWTMAENPDYAVIFTLIDESLFVNANSYLDADGELASNNGFSTTDYLEVPSNVKYLITNPNVSSVTSRLCFYDANKAMVQRLAVTDDAGLALYGEVPSNAVYFRFDKVSNVSAYSPFVKF